MINDLDLKALPKEYYGDQFRWFTGVVVDINDPRRANRVKVRIFGVHDENIENVPAAALPWAQTITPTTEDGVPGLGRTVGIKQGAFVFGFFLDGKMSQLPVVLGSIVSTNVDTSIISPKAEDPGLDDITSNLSDNASRQQDSTTDKITQDISARPPAVTLYPDAVKSAVGGSVAEKAFNFFKGTGEFNNEQAAAIVGILQNKSGLDASAAGGIGNWVGDRLNAFNDYASEARLNPKDLNTQMQFLMYEFSESASTLYGYSKFQAAPDLQSATELFVNYLPDIEPSEPAPAPEYPYVHPEDAAYNIYTYNESNDLADDQEGLAGPFADPFQGKTVFTRSNEDNGDIFIFTYDDDIATYYFQDLISYAYGEAPVGITAEPKNVPDALANLDRTPRPAEVPEAKTPAQRVVTDTKQNMKTAKEILTSYSRN